MASTARKLAAEAAPAVAVLRGAQARTRRSLGEIVSKVAPVVLSIAGFGSLAGAAWTFGVWQGLAATGVSLFLLEWRVSAE